MWLIFDGSNLRCVTKYHIIFSVLVESKNILNSTWQPANLHNLHLTNQRSQSNQMPLYPPKIGATPVSTPLQNIRSNFKPIVNTGAIPATPIPPPLRNMQSNIKPIVNIKYGFPSQVNNEKPPLIQVRKSQKKEMR